MWARARQGQAGGLQESVAPAWLQGLQARSGRDPDAPREARSSRCRRRLSLLLLPLRECGLRLLPAGARPRWINQLPPPRTARPAGRRAPSLAGAGRADGPHRQGRQGSRCARLAVSCGSARGYRLGEAYGEPWGRMVVGSLALALAVAPPLSRLPGRWRVLAWSAQSPPGCMQPLDGRAVGTAEQVSKAKRQDHLPGAKGDCNAECLPPPSRLPPARSPAHAPVAFAFLGMQPHVEVAVPACHLRVELPCQALELSRQGVTLRPRRLGDPGPWGIPVVKRHGDTPPLAPGVRCESAPGSWERRCYTLPAPGM